MIPVDLKEYETLLDIQTKYRILIEALQNSAELSWDKKTIAYDASKLTPVLKVIPEFNYEKIHESLKDPFAETYKIMMEKEEHEIDND